MIARRVVISLSGSFFEDVKLIKKYAEIFSRIKSKLSLLVVVCGGGKIAREYIEKGKKLGYKNKYLDMLGIACTHVNALLLSLYFKRKSIPRSYKEVDGTFVICGGMKPGQSTDKVATDIAVEKQADLIINLTKVDGVYVNGKVESYLTYDELLSIVSKIEQTPGNYALFDLKAVKLLKKHCIPLVFCNGRKPENLLKILSGELVGTLVWKKKIDWNKAKSFIKKLDAPVFRFSFKNDFERLIASILSTRTKDTVTLEVCRRLFKKVKSFEDIERMDIKELENLLKPVGFYREKAKKLKKLSRIIMERYGGQIPKSKEELLKLPGIGEKVYHVFTRERIAKDTHVKRISKNLGIKPEMLELFVPKEMWKDVNTLLVALGQTICNPVKPNCEKCPFKDVCEIYNQ